MKLSRRIVLKGLGGATLGLPLLESFLPRTAHAQNATAQTFAIFFRQANGVAQGGQGEPDRFWPKQRGPLTEATMQGQALDELTAVRSKLLILRNVNMTLSAYPTADGKTLLEHGVACWYNDNSNGPPPNHNRLLNTILTAVGVRKADGSPVDDFGDPSFQKGLLTELMA